MDGQTWLTAKQTVQAALMASASGGQIWVAEGTYKEQITLGDGVSVYGGFSGQESRLDQRNIAAHPTILSSADWDCRSGSRPVR